MLDHPNAALDLRIASGEEYREFLKTALRSPLGTDVEICDAMEQMYASCMQQLHEGPVDFSIVQSSYWKAIGFMPDAVSGKEKNLTLDDGTPSLRQNFPHHVIAITIALPVAVGLLLVGAAGFVWWQNDLRMKRRGWWWGGNLNAPHASQETTLMVTDIESSASLWEKLPGGVMDRAWHEHHKVLRDCLNKWDGYESGTEGDSFILAFHGPSDAVSFAVEAQAKLLKAAWPSELLLDPLCKPVSVMPCKSAQGYLQLFKSEISMKNPRARLVDDLTRMSSGKEVGKDAVSRKSRRPSSINMRIFQSFSTLAGPGTPLGLSEVDATQMIQWVANSEQPLPRVSSVEGPCKSNPANSLQPTASSRTMIWGVDVRAHLQLLMSVAGDVDSDTCFGGLTSTAELAQDPSMSKPEASILMWRGLRVRMGMHTGVGDSKDIEYNRITGRTEYSGESMAITKSVADAATGGMVTCTEATFQQVHPSSLDVSMVIAHMGELSFDDDSSMNVNVYQALAPEMLLRSAMMEPLRRCKQLSLGFLDAPHDGGAVAYLRIDTAAIARVNGEEMTKKVMKAVEPIVQHALFESRGYLLGFFGGVFLASFSAAG
eukprot:gene21495-28475_t